MTAAEQFLDQEPGDVVAAAECAAFVDDEQTRDVIESVARQFFDVPIVRQGGCEDALEFLAESPTPKVLIVDIGESAAPLTAMLSLTAAFTEQTRLIGIGTINDINLYREMVGAGITDYLVKPVTEKALAAAFCRTEEPVDAAAPATTAEQQAPQSVSRIAVVGARGGVGASSVAINLAWLLSHEFEQRTTLIDLDLEFGTVALALDLEPIRGLREALESPARIDGLFVESATARITEKLAVMATEETLAQQIIYNAEAIDILFDHMGKSNEFIIVDVPRSAFAVRQRVVELASNIIVVTELTLPGLRDAMRMLTGAEETALGTPVTVIANKGGGPHQAMPQKDFEKALGHKVDFVIPEDRKLFVQAANNGKPVVQMSSNSAASKALRRVAQKLAESQNPAQQESKKGSLRRFFKKG